MGDLIRYIPIGYVSVEHNYVVHTRVWYTCTVLYVHISALYATVPLPERCGFTRPWVLGETEQGTGVRVNL